MAKKKTLALVKLQIKAGAATPAPPVGTALGQHGVNIMDFCRQYNEATQQFAGQIIPVELTIYEDRSFSFVTKQPPAAELIKAAAGIEKGSDVPNRNKVGRLSQDQVRKIAEQKMDDLNANDVEHGMRIIAGTAREHGCGGGRMTAHGKRYREAETKVDREKEYAPKEAFSVLKSLPDAKFDETVEVAFNLGIDPRKADQMVRGTVSLPNGTGRSVRVAVFAVGDKAREATEAGADVVGGEELVEEVIKGNIDFDAAVATPDMMAAVGKAGRVLGPRGLMPNPKTGTVTMDIAKAVSDIKGGKVEYRSDRTGNVHVIVGKKSFDELALVENYLAVVDELLRAKPTGAKGRYIKSLAVSTTMGPSVRIDTAAPEGCRPERLRLARRRTGRRMAEPSTRARRLPWILVGVAVAFNLWTLRAELAERLVPERRRDPPVDGPLGGHADTRGTSAVRRLVPLPVARRVAVPPLPEPAAHPDRRVVDDRRSGHVPVVAVPPALHVADRRVLRRQAVRSRAVGGRRGGPRLAAHRERAGAGVRMVELRLAGIGDVGPALGDVGAAVRVGALVARRLEGSHDRARGPGARHHRLPPPPHGLSRAAELGRMGGVVAHATSGAGSGAPRSWASGRWRPPRGCSCR